MAALAAILLAGTGCDVLATAPPPTPTPAPRATPVTQRATVAVKRGTIVDAIKVLGRVVSSNEADLSFRNSGRIRDVYIQPGDLVQAGQVLAELDQRTLPWDLAKARTSVEAAQIRLAQSQAKDVVDDTAVDALVVRAAEIGVLQAQNTLNKLQAGPQDQDVKKAESDVATAQAALDKARFDVRDKEAQLVAKRAELDFRKQGSQVLDDLQTLAQARADVETAKVRLDQAQAGPRELDVRAAQLTLDQEKTRLDKLRDQPKVKPEDIEAARLDVEKAQNGMTKVLADVDAGNFKGDTAKEAAITGAQLALRQAQNTLDKLTGTAVTDVELRLQEQAVQSADLALQKIKTPQSIDVQAAQATLAAAQGRVAALERLPSDQELASITAQIQALELNVETTKQQVGVSEASLAAAQARYTLVTQGATDFDARDAQNKLALAQSQVASANAKLATKQETIRQTRAVNGFDLETLQRAINQAQLDVKNFESQTGDVKIIAPFAGQITRLAGRPGDNVQAFFPVVNVSSLEGLVVKADIAEGDLPRVAVGMPVDLTMDAYPNRPLKGVIETLPELTVGQVGQAPDRATRIRVQWPGPGAEMGMLARVQITLQVKPNVLMVPNGAVRTVGKRRFVEYMDGDIKRSRNVETGISTESDTEITSGLTEGMVILAGQS